MRTLFDATNAITIRAVVRALCGLPTEVQQVDLELASDGRGICAYAYFGDDRESDVYLVGWDLPERMTQAEFEDRREALGRELLHLEDCETEHNIPHADPRIAQRSPPIRYRTGSERIRRNQRGRTRAHSRDDA